MVFWCISHPFEAPQPFPRYLRLDNVQNSGKCLALSCNVKNRMPQGKKKPFDSPHNYWYRRYTPPKFNSSPLKNGGWRTILSYCESNFQGRTVKVLGVYIRISHTWSSWHPSCWQVPRNASWHKAWDEEKRLIGVPPPWHVLRWWSSPRTYEELEVEALTYCLINFCLIPGVNVKDIYIYSNPKQSDKKYWLDHLWQGNYVAHNESRGRHFPAKDLPSAVGGRVVTILLLCLCQHGWRHGSLPSMVKRLSQKY